MPAQREYDDSANDDEDWSYISKPARVCRKHVHSLRVARRKICSQNILGESKRGYGLVGGRYFRTFEDLRTASANSVHELIIWGWSDLEASAAPDPLCLVR